jgi:hypothetical protein
MELPHKIRSIQGDSSSLTLYSTHFCVEDNSVLCDLVFKTRIGKLINALKGRKFYL